MTDPIRRYRALLKAGQLECDPAQERVAELLELLHNRLGHYQPPRRGLWALFNGRTRQAPTGLYLFGDVGRGKSMLMDLFFDDAPLTRKRRVHFHSFMLETHEALNAWRKLGPRERGRQANYVKEAGDDPIAPVARGIAGHAQLLCFDEFQVADIADAMILGRLFEALLAEGVVIVATSNRAPDELYEGGLNRQLFLPFIELVKNRLDVLHLDGPQDYRMKRLAGAPVYYAPLGDPSDVQMDAAWRRLTDCSTGEPAILEVQGRALAVPQAAKGTARFAFADLAEQPLGAADYLAIAQHFHTLFVDRIPRLTRDKRNEAKRFVTLIDVLYDNRVKLVCSAAGPPDALYPQGDGSVDFRRTASRLIEMQSTDYLAQGHAV